MRSKCVCGCEQVPRIRCTPTFFHHPIFDNYTEPSRIELCSGQCYQPIANKTRSGKTNCCQNKANIE